MTNTPTIIQSDRDAAADLAAQFQRYTLVQIEAPAIRRGEHDDWELVKAFAAHRNAALSPPEADIVERCAKVASARAALSHSHPQQAMDREAVAWALASRFIERGSVRGLEAYPWKSLADVPCSYRDDFLADADAIIALSPTPGLDAEAPEAFAVREAARKLTMPNGQILECEYPDSSNWARSWSIRYPDDGRIGTTGEQEDEIVERYGLTAILEAVIALTNLPTGSTEAGLSQAGLVDALTDMLWAFVEAPLTAAISAEGLSILQTDAETSARSALSQIKPEGERS